MNSESTVFIVDDDPGALQSLAFLLGSEGYQIETYVSATAFLNVYAPDRPGCLVLDVRMAEMNGLQLQNELAARDWNIPIIFVTGHGEVGSSVAGMKGGAIDFLEKPVDDEKVLARVREAIEQDAANRREAEKRAKIQARIDRATAREDE